MYRPKTLIIYAIKLKDCIIAAKQPLFEVGVDILRFFVTRKKGKNENETGRRNNNSAQGN